MKEILLLIVLFPLAGFIINGLGRNVLDKKYIAYNACGQILTSFVFSVIAFMTVKDTGGQTVKYFDFIKQTNEIITQSISDLRALTKSLDGDFVKDFGLEESISHELQRIRKTRRFQTEISVLGEKRKLGYEREIVLFRIVQEILNNALKHSKAKNLTIILHYFTDSFTLTVNDNGKGFDLENINQKTIWLASSVQN